MKKMLNISNLNGLVEDLATYWANELFVDGVLEPICIEAHISLCYSPKKTLFYFNLLLK
jgi:hypothetical protein